MSKIINVVIILVLFLVVIITVNFIWGRNTNKTVVLTVENNSLKKMKNLVVKNDLQKYGIEVITSTDSSFKGELTQYVGNENSLISLVESTEPFAFFIKNNFHKDIVGVSLRWKFSGNGRGFEIPQSEANPGVLMGIKPLDPQMIGKTSLINSKAVKLFTYFKSLIEPQIALTHMRVNNSLVENNYNNDFKQTNQLSLNSQKEKLLNECDDFSVTIDGILFSDGTFVGADQNLFFPMLNGDIQARKEILTSLQNAKLTGKKNTEIVDDILTRTSNISLDSTEMHSSSRTQQQVSDYSYNNYLKNLRREIMRKRSVMSDDSIIEQFQTARVSDFVTLHKEDNYK